MGTLRRNGFPGLVLSQMLGAFNDNAIQYLAIFALYKSPHRSLYMSLAGALLILPFVLFSSLAGWLSDRYCKRTVLIWTKVWEVAAMALAVFALWTRNPLFLLAVIFYMGSQSAFFSPAKYGSVPELCSQEDVGRANGLLEMTVFAGIILGSAASGHLFNTFEHRLALAGLPLVAAALAGTAVLLPIRRVPATGAARPLTWNVVGQLAGDLRVLRSHRDVFASALAFAWFMLVGAVFKLNIVVYGRDELGLTESETGELFAIAGLGIVLGSALAGRLSKREVELGLLPVGAAGLAASLAGLGLSTHSYIASAGLMAVLGLSGGLFIVPLSSLIQLRSPASDRGRIMATWNFLNFAGVFAGSALFYLLRSIRGLTPSGVFIVVGMMTVPVGIYVLRAVPMFFTRFLARILLRAVYRITVLGLENIPEEGGAVLVANHVSFADPFLLSLAAPRRVRFLMLRHYYEKPLTGWFGRLFGAIPISERDRPRTILRQLHRAQAAIRRGELLCIFAEGALSRTGNIGSLKRGFETVARRVGAPIIPVHLDRVWGSIFSFAGGRFFYKLPRHLPYPVTVSFARPLPPTADAFAVRQAIVELSADAAGVRKRSQRPLHCAFMRTARRRWFGECMADSSGRRLSWGRALAGSLCLAHALRRRCAGQAMVGLFLPTSVGAALANIAAEMAGKIPVNLNYTASRDALRSVLRQCGIRTILTSQAFLRRARIDPTEEMVLIEDLLGEIGRRRRVLYLLAAALLPAWLAERLMVARPGMDDTATVMFSSGSTGEPKGVVLSHHNIMSNIESFTQVINFTRRDVLLGVLPFFHGLGLTTLWAPMTAGVKAVYHFNPLDPETIGELVHAHRGTVLMSTPTFYGTYVRKCTSEQFATLRLAIAGGEKLSGQLAERFQERFGLPLLEGYGCTEAAPVISVNVPDMPHMDGIQRGQKAGSVGQTLPGVAARIVDPDSFEPLGADQEGLLLVRGPNLMQGYFNDPERTSQVFHDGWYITGDIARIDRDGFITLTDRLSRFSKIGGEMVPHLRIEQAIEAAVGEPDFRCVVVSLPAEGRGERLVVLHTKADLDPAAVRKHMSDEGLPNLWIPDRKAFLHVDEIPRLGLGKPDMKKARELARELSETCDR